MATQYRALTRTYRPQTFDDIVSQEHVSSTLKNAIKQERISHAYMFCGPRGVGKTTMARVLARTINQIDNDIDGESLNQTLNVVEIDAASNNKVEDIHHLRETVRVPPQNGRYKVYIIDEVHMLSKSAFNALLKTLEEPPPHAIFIFATTEPHKVLPTILSRVQRFDFKRISVQEIVSRLKSVCQNENIQVDDESLHVIAKKADGALRDALGLMDQAIAFCGTQIKYQELIQALNVVGKEQLFEFTDAIAAKDAGKGLVLIDQMLRNGIDIQEFLVSLTEHIRNFYVALQSDQMHLVEETDDMKARYKRSVEPFSSEDLMRMLHLVSDAQIKIRDAQQPRVHFEIVMLKLVHMSRTPELNSLIRSLEEIKKNGSLQQIETTSTSEEPDSAELDDFKDQQNTSTEKQDLSYSKTNGQQSLVNENDEPASDGENREEAQNQPGPDTSGSDEDEFLQIRPTLGNGNHNPLQDIQTAKLDKSVQKTEQTTTLEAPKTLAEVEMCWEPFIKKLESNAPRMLFLQLEQVQLKSVKGRDIFISASNEFAYNLMEENQRLLSELFKEITGSFFRFICKVEKNSNEQLRNESPYERFEKIQRKDPHLRTIVELFGAELEY